MANTIVIIHPLFTSQTSNKAVVLKVFPPFLSLITQQNSERLSQLDLKSHQDHDLFFRFSYLFIFFDTDVVFFCIRWTSYCPLPELSDWSLLMYPSFHCELKSKRSPIFFWVSCLIYLASIACFSFICLCQLSVHAVNHRCLNEHFATFKAQVVLKRL